MASTVVAEDRSATGRRRVFHILDALRGIAALAVVQRHTAGLLGQDAWPSTYLAVDLFFVLSGFVIAYSYETRLATSMGWRRFMSLRVIRIYPLYAVGLALGGIALLGNQLQRPSGPDWSVTGQALASAVLMLPNWHLPAVVGPRWSLTYELIANAAYAAVAPRLTTPVLTVFTVAMGSLLIATTAWTGSVDSGWDFDQAHVALARVFFSFPMGVLLFRAYDQASSRKWLAGALIVLALLAVASAIVMPQPLRAELPIILLAFPIVTGLAALIDVPRPWTALCGILGTTSYALYVIHQPASVLFEAFAKRVSRFRPDRAVQRLSACCAVAAGLLASGPLLRRAGPSRSGCPIQQVALMHERLCCIAAGIGVRGQTICPSRACAGRTGGWR